MDHDEPFRETDMAGWDRYFRGRKDSSDSKRKGWLVHTFFDDQVYLPEPDKTEAKYKKYRTKAVAYLGDTFYHPKKKPTRLIFADGSEAVRREIRRVIETNFSDEVEVVFPGDDFVDVHKKGVSKGAALQKLCNMWDISLSEVIAFGNTEMMYLC